MSKYKDQIKEILRYLSFKGRRVLSIGNQEDDRKYFEIVAEEYLTMDCNEHFHPDILFDLNRSFEGEDGFDIPDKYLGYFDLVLALNLFEYIYDPVTALKNIRDLLCPNGMALLSFPFIYPVHRPDGEDFLRYTPDGALKLLSVAGLRLRWVNPIFGNHLLLEYYGVDGLKARAGFDHTITGVVVEAQK